MDIKIDPRRLAALQLEIDALALEVERLNDTALNDALNKAGQSLIESARILAARTSFLTIPPDYVPPEISGRPPSESNEKPKKPARTKLK
jgi:hypothetical protein